LTEQGGKLQDLRRRLAGVRFKPLMEKHDFKSDSIVQALEKFELPLHFRSWNSGGRKTRKKTEGEASLARLTDGLPFPALATAVLGGATFAAHAVLHGRRSFVDEFAASLGRSRPSGRTL